MMKRDQNFWKVAYFMQKYQLLIYHHCTLHSLLLVKEKQKHMIISFYFHVVISDEFFISFSFTNVVLGYIYVLHLFQYENIYIYLLYCCLLYLPFPVTNEDCCVVLSSRAWS